MNGNNLLIGIQTRALHNEALLFVQLLSNVIYKLKFLVPIINLEDRMVRQDLYEV